MNIKVLKRIFFLTVIYSVALLGQDRTLRVACIGNSITIGSGGPTAYPQQLGQRLGSHFNVRNFGVSGTTLLKHGDFPYWNEGAFLQAQDFDAHIIIISLGTNDSKPQNRIFLNEYFNDYMEFISVLRKNGRDPQIFVCNPCPVFGAEGASGINGNVVRDQIYPLVDSVRTAARGFAIDWYHAMLSHEDLFPDGIHPNATGYAMMADTAAAAIRNSPSGFIWLFGATDTEVELGETSMLYWEATPGSKVKLDGVLVNSIDSLQVTPAQLTTYTLVAGGAVADTKRVVIDRIPSGRIKTLKAFPLQLDQGAADSSMISWCTTSGSQVFMDGVPVAEDGSLAVRPASTSTYTLIAQGNETDTMQVTIEVLPSQSINRALLHPITFSSALRGSNAEWAVDGDTTTSWQSAGKNTEWIMIDLGRTLVLNTLRIRWDLGFATSYAIHLLDAQGKAIKSLTQTKGDGGLDEFAGLANQARYVRLLCTKSNGSTYSVKEFEVFGVLVPAAVERNDRQPQLLSLQQNYPNPFNPATTIAYYLPRASRVHLSIYDINGRLVRILANGEQAEGLHRVPFNAGDLCSGTYFYQLACGKEVRQKRMILIK